MKKLILICLVIIATISCKKIFPEKNKNKIAVVNTSNYNCSAKVRIDGGSETTIEKGGAYTFENITNGNHTVTLVAVSPCQNYSSGSSCSVDFSNGTETKTVTVSNTSGAQLVLYCN
jgi:hypothetical protein